MSDWHITDTASSALVLTEQEWTDLVEMVRPSVLGPNQRQFAVAWEHRQPVLHRVRRRSDLAERIIAAGPPMPIDVHEMQAALNDGRMALAKAIGMLEAHWEVCADPFPDASLRRALDRMEAAVTGSNGTPEVSA